jgi:hypothetical protein
MEREIGISGTYMFHLVKDVPGKEYKMQACGSRPLPSNACRPVNDEYIKANSDLKWCKKCF